MSTSGGTFRFFEHAGRRYGHTLDPRTGRPAEGVLSVTVLAPTAAEADGLSTALFVMGVEGARAFCSAHPHVGAIITAERANGEGDTRPSAVFNIPDADLELFGPQTESEPEPVGDDPAEE
jgi:thiamine biosynthesis lipoprotein